MNSKIRGLVCLFVIFTLTSCQTATPKNNHRYGHVQENVKDEGIPEPARVSVALPVPAPEKKEPVHTVVVNDVPLRDLLFSLARDADLNLDVDEKVIGRVTLNAINQPLAAILDRIAENHDLRYSIKRDILRIQRDSPYIRNYTIDYLNITRTATATVSVSTQISATGQGAGESGDQSGGDNNSQTQVQNRSDQTFWESLEANIASILGSVEGSAAQGESHPDIMVNRGSGLIAVRANSRQHKEVQEFIYHVLYSSQRQVLIEATIAEVTLSDGYQAGIDWTKLEQDIGESWGAGQALTDIALFDRPAFNFTFSEDDGSGNILQSTLSALETFGDVSVMSSPKVMAMNNQTALLKVVDNLVYFTVDVNIDEGSEGEGRLYTYESQIHTVPVGFVMGVTPYISSAGEVTLNVRPTISRVIGQARDPNPALADAEVISEIPIIQVREVESVLKVRSGEVAVIGGLMQDEISNTHRGIPFLARIPFLGPLFRYQDDAKNKTELVIFIKPLVVEHASLSEDLKAYQPVLQNFQEKFNR